MVLQKSLLVKRGSRVGITSRRGRGRLRGDEQTFKEYKRGWVKCPKWYMLSATESKAKRGIGRGNVGRL